MIKRIIFLFSFLFSVALFAQAPQGINYQGVARDNAGNALSKTNIGVEFKLYQNSTSGTLVYSEVYSSVLTDTFGLYSLTIGGAPGTGVGTFTAIPWSGGNIWVEVYIDPANGGSFTSPIAAQQLMSVPYALYAQTSGSGGGTGLDSVRGIAHNIPKFNKFGNVLKRSIINESLDSSSVGIGVLIPNNNAALEIANTGNVGGAGKGLLIPRMTLNERTLIPSPPHGLIVFQTNNGGVTAPEGFWYYDGVNSAWLLLSPAQAVWTLSGSLVGAGNFLGSLNAADVVFKTGSTLLTTFERMRLLNGSGRIQFGDGTAANSYVFPLNRGNAGDVLQLDPAGTNNLIWAPFSGGTSNLWVKSGPAIYQNTLSDSVGIGTSSPQAKLDVFTNTGIGLQVTTNDTLNPVASIVSSNPVNGYPALDVNSSNGKGNAINATANNAYALSGQSGDASALWLLNNSGGSATIDAMNNGTHSVAYFHNSSLNSTAPVLYSITNDPAGYSAQFVGGLGITTNGFQFTSTTAAAGNILQSDAAGTASWVTPASVFGSQLWSQTSGNIHPTSGGANVGIGTSTPGSMLTVLGSSTSPVIFAQNTGGADGINGQAAGSGSGVFGLNSANGAGVTGFSNGTGNAGFFQVSNGSNIATALDVTHQGKGIVASFANTIATNTASVVNISDVGTGPAIAAFSTGTGSVANFQINNSANSSSAMNISTNGVGYAINAMNSGSGNFGAGNFQNTNNTTTAPTLSVSSASNAPAVKVNGSGNPGGIAALFNGGAVAIGTGTVAPSSGLDVKTSIGVSVKKYPNPGNFPIPLTDQNVLHLAGTSGTFTYTLPDATLCPGRLLIFTSDNPTGGSIIINPCCSQSLNGGASQTISLSSGPGKPSLGIISDGSNWQIIFKN